MDLSERPAAKTKLVGGRLCLDFVNTVGGRRDNAVVGESEQPESSILNDKLNDYFDLLAWSHHTGLLSLAELQILIREGHRHPHEAESVFERAISLREGIYRICKAIISGRQTNLPDIDLLNAELMIARSREKLTASADGFTWEWHGAKSELDRVLWPIARSAAELLTSGDHTRLHECGGENCHWLFEDVTRNRSRHWCDMKDCGNLAKVRRFRTRLRNEARTGE